LPKPLGTAQLEVTTTAEHYSYKPRIDPTYWARIEPFVTSVVREAAEKSVYSEKQLYSVATPIALWTTVVAGLPLRTEVVFSSHAIDRFAAEGLAQYTKAGRGTMRSRLRQMAQILLPPEKAISRERPMGPSDPTAPYSRAELIELRSWANSQRSPARRMDARALLALGIGAGLAGREIIAMRTGDLTPGSDGGVIVRVGGRSPRAVPVLADWEDELLAVMEQRDGWAFRSGHEDDNPNLITDFVSRSRGKIALQARRMHSTWVVHHLDAGTPLVPLMRAAGVQSAEAFDRYLKFVQQPDEAWMESSLRGSTQ
jgi:integrase